MIRALALLALLACSDKAAQPPAAGSGFAVGAPAPKPAASDDPWASSGPSITKPLPKADPPPGPPKLAVVDAGKPPRVELRYAVSAVDRDVAFVMDDPDRNEQFSDMRYRVKCSGTACTYQMTKFDVLGDSTQFDYIRKEVRGSIAVPASGPIEVTPDGIMSTTPSTPELFKLAVVPLPTEAVGVGARWTVTDGVATRVFRLVRHDGRTLVVDTLLEASNSDMRFRQAGELTIGLDDPFGKGKLATVQTILANASLQMNEHSDHKMLSIE